MGKTMSPGDWVFVCKDIRKLTAAQREFMGLKCVVEDNRDGNCIVSFEDGQVMRFKDNQLEW